MKFKFDYKNGKLEFKRDTTRLESPNIEETLEYYIFKTFDKAFYFDVSNIDKTLMIREKVPAACSGLIDQKITFSLWNEFYSDTIFPGKTEIIHKDTLIRSIKYENSDAHSVDMPLNNIGEAILICDAMKKSEGARYFITHSNDPIIQNFMSIIYQHSVNTKNPVLFRPHNDFKNSQPFVTFDEVMICDQTLDLSANHNWLVFSKTHRDRVFLVESYIYACAMLAKLKYDLTIPFFQCGVSLFEDYYFMPLLHKKLTISSDMEIKLEIPRNEYKVQIEELMDVCKSEENN